MANRWSETVIVCSKVVDLEKLLRTLRQHVGDAEGMPTAEECPDGLPVLTEDLRLSREAVKGVAPLVVAAPFPGRAIWVIRPPRFGDEDGGERVLTAVEETFGGAVSVLRRHHGSTGAWQLRCGEVEVDRGSDCSKEEAQAYAAIERRLDEQLGVSWTGVDVDDLDRRPGAVPVPLDEVDPERLRAASASLVAAMGPDPRIPQVDLGVLPPPAAQGEEVAPVDPGRAAAEAASAAQLRMLGFMLLALAAMAIVFAVMAKVR